MNLYDWSMPESHQLLQVMVFQGYFWNKFSKEPVKFGVSGILFLKLFWSQKTG